MRQSLVQEFSLQSRVASWKILDYDSIVRQMFEEQDYFQLDV